MCKHLRHFVSPKAALLRQGLSKLTSSSLATLTCRSLDDILRGSSITVAFSLGAGSYSERMRLMFLGREGTEVKDHGNILQEHLGPVIEFSAAAFSQLQ